MSSSLARHLAATQGLSLADADAAVAAFVADVQARSESGLPVVYPGLGTFALGPDGLAFVPDAGLALVVNHRYAGLDAGSGYATPDVSYRSGPPAVAAPRFAPLAAAIPPAEAAAPVSGPGADLPVAPVRPPVASPDPAAPLKPAPTPEPPRRRSVAVPFVLLALVGLVGLVLLYTWWQRARDPLADAPRTAAPRVDDTDAR